MSRESELVHQSDDSSRRPSCPESVQTDLTVSLEVETENRQRKNTEKYMRRYIKLLQEKLEEQRNKVVEGAARLREVEAQLAEIRSTKASPTSQKDQQLEDGPEYKSEKTSSALFFSCFRHIQCTHFVQNESLLD